MSTIWKRIAVLLASAHRPLSLGAVVVSVLVLVVATTLPMTDRSAPPELELRDTFAASEKWQDRLNFPASVTKLDNKWFIVDTWHHRILWSYNLFANMADWQVMDDTLTGPHSISFDGNVFMVDDTDANAVNIYSFDNERFSLKQRLPDIGLRPHRVVYDNDKQAFYVIASRSQEIFKIVRTDDTYAVDYRKKLDFLDDRYTRSITIHDGHMYFVPNGEIIMTSHDDEYEVLVRSKVPKAFTGLNDIYHDGHQFHVTATPAAFGTVEDLGRLPTMRNQWTELGMQGRPYFISVLDDGRLIIPETGENSAIRIRDRTTMQTTATLLYSGPESESSLNRHNWPLVRTERTAGAAE